MSVKTYIATIDGQKVPVLLNATSAFEALDAIFAMLPQTGDTPKITVKLAS